MSNKSLTGFADWSQEGKSRRALRLLGQKILLTFCNLFSTLKGRSGGGEGYISM